MSVRSFDYEIVFFLNLDFLKLFVSSYFSLIVMGVVLL